MEIQITNRHDVAKSGLKKVIEAELDRLEKFNDKITSAHVIIDVDGSDEVVEIVASLRGKKVRVSAKSEAAGKSFVEACEKLGRVLKKENEKAKDHRAPKSSDIWTQ